MPSTDIERRGVQWCWGSWNGAHGQRIPLEHIIDIALKVKAQTYSFERRTDLVAWISRPDAMIPCPRGLMQ